MLRDDVIPCPFDIDHAGVITSYVGEGGRARLVHVGVGQNALGLGSFDPIYNSLQPNLVCRIWICNKCDMVNIKIQFL